MPRVKPRVHWTSGHLGKGAKCHRISARGICPTFYDLQEPRPELTSDSGLMTKMYTITPLGVLEKILQFSVLYLLLL